MLCIYCPDTNACYYLDPKAFGDSVTLRVILSRNNQARNVLVAEHFRSIPTKVLALQVGTVPGIPTPR